MGSILAGLTELFFSIPVFFLSAFLNALFGIVFNSKISIYSFELGSFISFQLAAVSGSISIMCLSKIWLNRVCYVSKLSKYAILMLGIQYFLRIPFSKAVNILGISKTITYDVCALLETLLIIWIVPMAYEVVRKRIEIVKYYNGE